MTLKFLVILFSIFLIEFNIFEHSEKTLLNATTSLKRMVSDKQIITGDESCIYAYDPEKTD